MPHHAFPYSWCLQWLSDRCRRARHTYAGAPAPVTLDPNGDTDSYLANLTPGASVSMPHAPRLDAVCNEQANNYGKTLSGQDGRDTLPEVHLCDAPRPNTPLASQVTTGHPPAKSCTWCGWPGRKTCSNCLVTVYYGTLR